VCPKLGETAWTTSTHLASRLGSHAILPGILWLEVSVEQRNGNRLCDDDDDDDDDDDVRCRENVGWAGSGQLCKFGWVGLDCVL